MKRLSTLLLTASITASVMATGCIQPTGDAVSDAIPTAQDVRVNLPDSAGEAPAALGEVSEYYAMTRGITRGFNAGAGFVLVLVHAIVQMPPTTVDGNTYTWGPGSDPLDPADYRLTVIDNLDGTYDWSLDGKSKFDPNAEFLTAVSGLAVAGDEAHRGSGEFTLNFTNMKALDPIEHNDDGDGTITVIYDLENRDGTAASLEMHIDGTDENGQAVVADYAYAENQDGSGDFQFSLPADVDENGSALEDIILRSRWMADGSGRGDARISGGDAGDEVVEASQCWSTSFRTVYETSTHPEILPEAGDVSECAFADQDLPELPGV
ncbi:MAG: hypothetical protein KJO07_19925 [Deltaproteobacteria bacterium]|jgi:hypothetical protein|nr:hypothetical protein [Deltaproteobacteria bacterium]